LTLTCLDTKVEAEVKLTEYELQLLADHTAVLWKKAAMRNDFPEAQRLATRLLKFNTALNFIYSVLL